MFDPVSLVVNALVNGLLAGLEASAQEAVLDGYRALRNYIVHRYGRRVEASIERLEEQPSSLSYQAAVTQELRDAGAERDPELTQLARQLSNLVENPDGGASIPNPVSDPVEELLRTSGHDAVSQVLEEHLRQIESIRSRYSLEDAYLLTPNIVYNADLPDAVREGVLRLHDRIRYIIERIATRIQEAQYEEVESSINNLEAGLLERQRAAHLVQTEKQLHISYEALRLAVEFFSKFNENLLERIEHERSEARQSYMMFGNAVMIYELADFVIRYIQGFSIGDDLNKLRAEKNMRINEIREKQEALESALRVRDDVAEAVRDQTLQTIRIREGAFEQILREWDQYMDEQGRLRSAVGEVQSWIPTLEVMREDAQIQIMTLQEVAMLAFLKRSSESIQHAVLTLQSIRLAPLSAARVRRLLRFDQT